MDVQYIDAARVVVSIGIFAVASYSDYRTRTIENHVWLIGGVAGSIFLFLHLFLISSGLIGYILSIFAIALFFIPYIDLEDYGVSETQEFYIELSLYFSLAFATFFIGIYWFAPENILSMGIVAIQVLIRVFYELNIIHGGADAKALMLIGLMFPSYPRILVLPLFVSEIPLLEQMFPFALTVLFNAVVWFIFYPLVLLIYNATRGDLKFPAALFGYKLPLESVKKKYVWLMEHPVEGKIVFRYSPDKDDDEGIKEEIIELEKLGKKDVWVTPQIPFIIPISVGLVISIIFGNVFFIITGISVLHTLLSQAH
ncbi:MAG: A24 family peptidase C-terminal domain-containing protein [Thermoplasmata archaeon]